MNYIKDPLRCHQCRINHARAYQEREPLNEVATKLFFWIKQISVVQVIFINEVKTLYPCLRKLCERSMKFGIWRSQNGLFPHHKNNFWVEGLFTNFQNIYIGNTEFCTYLKKKVFPHPSTGHCHLFCLSCWKCTWSNSSVSVEKVVPVHSVHKYLPSDIMVFELSWNCLKIKYNYKVLEILTTLNSPLRGIGVSSDDHDGQTC